MAALPISLRRELEQEYKRQQSESIARPSIPKFVHTEPSVVPNLAKGASTSKTERLVKQPQDLKTADRQTLLTNLWCGSPPKWVPLFKEFKLAGKCILPAFCRWNSFICQKNLPFMCPCLIFFLFCRIMNPYIAMQFVATSI
jgi:hypothetical protein